MKSSLVRRMAWCGLLVTGFVFLPACEQSTHRSTRVRTYNDEPEEKRSESDELDGEYKMQSEGEMSGG